MKLFLFVTLLGTALASPGGFTYSHSTAYGPLARNALAYGGFGHYSHEGPVTAYTANAPAFAGHVASYAAAPAFATYGAAAPAVATYGAAAPAFATYAAAAPAVATYAAAAPAVATYATAAPAVATYATAAPAVASYATHAVAHAPVATYAAAAPVHAVAAPAAAVVPVTRLSAQPAVVQNVVDVAQPKLATRRFEIRRPAIQKQFYDVEERVVVRPAGSAVVELDTPIGANQRGPTQIRPAAPPVALNAYTSTHLATPTHHPVFPAGSFAIPAIPHHPAVVEQSQEVTQQIEQTSQIQQQPIPQQPIQEQPGQEQQFDDSDSVSVENPDISTRTQAPQRLPSPPFRSQLPDFPRAEATQLPQYQRGSLSEQLSSVGLPSFSRSRVTQYLQPEPLPEQQAQLTQASSARQQEASISFSRTQQQAVSSTPEVSPRLGPTPQPLQEEFDSRSFGAEVIPSVRNLSPEQSQANQARLIDLLTARGPVSEVRSASEPIRGRVLSATPAPPGSEPADERVNTRRIVVNRPIQTVQEVDVVQPFTKLERLAVHQPAVVKTAHLEYAAVPAVHTAFPAAVTVAPHYYKK